MKKGNFGYHSGRAEGRHFLLHAIGYAAKHGRTASKDDVAIEIPSHVDIAFHDRIVAHLVDTR